MTKNIFALVDCNNFYVSCERVFNPRLEGKPVIVLSSNDGCCVARSNEVKALGIPMGAPFFKIKEIVKQHKIQVFSSNYELYGDMSWRVMQTISNICPEIELYSVDEAFLHLNFTSQKYQEIGEKIRQTVKKNTGIPVSVGVATTKTLAKVANEIAKKQPMLDGVLSFAQMSADEKNNYLKLLEVGEVWGVGRKSAQKLQKYAIRTAYDLSIFDEKIAKKVLSVVGMRTVTELKGVPCISLDNNPVAQKSICSSRSFGSYVTDFNGLRESIASHIDRGCEKLRRDGSVSRYVTIFIRTNKFNHRHQQDHCFVTKCLDIPSNYPPDFYEVAIPALAQIFKTGFKYNKAGIYLSEITPENAIQQHLYDDEKNNLIEPKKTIIGAVDQIRKRYGRSSIRFGNMGIKPSWYAKSSHRSQRYSTQLADILVAR